MQDVEIIGMLRTYVNQTLIGMGALKGASCQIQSIVDGTDDHTITFKWVDENGDPHTSTFVVKDGTNGTDGVSPTITVKTSTDNTYILTITTDDGSFDTPNLKGGGSGGDSSIATLTDVVLDALADGDILVYDSESEKWVNSNELSNKVDSVSVNGVEQTITDGAVDIDVASNLITEEQWTAIQALLV